MRIAILLLAFYVLGWYFEGQPSETDALQRTADIDNERAAEWVAMKE